MESMISTRDMMKLLDDDTTIHILKYLDTPADVAHASIVSRSWRRLVVEGQLWKGLCHRTFPELDIIEEVIEIDVSRGRDAAGSSDTSYHGTLEKNHRVYRQLYREITQTPLSERSCIRSAIAASSTDKYPDESIHQTLIPMPRNSRHRFEGPSWSYWSSKGQEDPRVPETLTYKLLAPLCVVHEIHLRPFEAEFQLGKPIYSSKYVRFRFGYQSPKPSDGDETPDYEDNSKEEFPWTSGSPPEYNWIYVSPEFPMKQADEIQTFKLPRPVLCTGQIMQVELLERVQTQKEDLLYYICVCYIRVVGKPIRNFGFSPLEAGGRGGLICQRSSEAYSALPSKEYGDYTAAADAVLTTADATDQNFAERVRQLRLSRGLFHNTSVLNRILGNLAVASLLLATGEYIDDDDEDDMSDEEPNEEEEDSEFEDDEPEYLL